MAVERTPQRLMLIPPLMHTTVNKSPLHSLTAIRTMSAACSQQMIKSCDRSQVPR